MANTPLLSTIETQFDVEKIKVNNLHFWPFIRNYIGSYLHFQKDREVKVSSQNVLPLLKSLGFGFWNYLKPARYVFMSSSDQRKLIDGKYKDRMNFYAKALNEDNYLFIEHPNPQHYPYKATEGKNKVSKIWWYGFELLISPFLSIKIENEQILKDILNEYKLPIDHKKMAQKFIAQYKVAHLFFKWKKTERFFCTTAYINCAKVKAAKTLGIQVVEFQHGIINKSHYAYNVPKAIDSSFYPDYLLTFGEQEKEVFSAENYYIAQNRVLPIGSFYIDYLLEKSSNINPEIKRLKNKYKNIIAFSCQDAMEELWIPFFKEISENDKENAYILMPRHKKAKDYAACNFSNNVYFMPQLNTYQIMAQADIHSTINSTTAIESLALGTPNILLNVNDLAKKYLSKTLQYYTQYANNPKEYLELIKNFKSVKKEEIIETNRDNIVPQFKQRIPQIIQDIEKK